MSKNRKKKKTQSRKPNQSKKQQKKQPLKWHEKALKTSAVYFNKVKTFFVNLFSKIDLQAFKKKSSNFIKKIFFIEQLTKVNWKATKDKTLKHMTKNRNAYAFFSAMLVIVTIGYFVIVAESDSEKADRLALHSATEESYMAVEDQLGDIQNGESNELVVSIADLETENALANSDVQSADTVNETSTEDNTISNEITDDSLAVAEPVDRITSSTLSKETQAVTTMNTAPAYKTVSDSVMLGIDMYALVVDGKEVACFETEGEAYVVLNELKRSFTVNGAVNERIIFQEAIEVQPIKKNVLEFTEYESIEHVMEYIRKGTNEQKIHVTTSGENPWTISSKYGLNVDSLLAANPEVKDNPKGLQIGQELSLIVPEPIINVVTITILERIDPIPYGRDENVETDKLYQGQTSVKVRGISGEAVNEVEQYMVNGNIIGEKILSTEVIKEPTNQTMLVGTMPPPPKIGTGTWKNPTSRGYITSGFGSRSLGYHNGIDIGVSRGTEVKAADGGVVIFAGYKGTYGKLVMIDHGANTISYYAHNDSFKVQKGDTVYQGQVISLSGNTGRSTGPHLHFEVRINGSPVNPKKFVNY